MKRTECRKTGHRVGDQFSTGFSNVNFILKKSTRTHDKLCRNAFNVTGMCNRKSCPLSNSQYATIRERKGTLFLFMKTAERYAFPNKLWERVKLSRNLETAIAQLNENLLYWPSFIKTKCKLRLMKLTQVIIRSRKLKLQRQKLLVPVRQKIDRREKKREEKALIAARIEQEVEKTLINRLKERLTEDEHNICEEVFEQVQQESDVDEEEEAELQLANNSKLLTQFVEDNESNSDNESERAFLSNFEESENSDMEDSNILEPMLEMN